MLFVDERDRRRRGGVGCHVLLRRVDEHLHALLGRGKALAQACERASRKAQVAAAALGCEIVGFERMDIGYENQVYRATTMDVYEEYAMEDALAYDAVEPISFDPGTVEISASVDIDFVAVKQ